MRSTSLFLVINMVLLPRFSDSCPPINNEEENFYKRDKAARTAVNLNERVSDIPLVLPGTNHKIMLVGGVVLADLVEEPGSTTSKSKRQKRQTSNQNFNKQETSTLPPSFYDEYYDLVEDPFPAGFDLTEGKVLPPHIEQEAPKTLRPTHRPRNFTIQTSIGILPNWTQSTWYQPPVTPSSPKLWNSTLHPNTNDSKTDAFEMKCRDKIFPNLRNPPEENFVLKAGVQIKDRVYLCGGRKHTKGDLNGAVSKKCFIASENWKEGPPMIIERYGHTMTYEDGSLFVIGGANSNGEVLDSIEFLVLPNLGFKHSIDVILEPQDGSDVLRFENSSAGNTLDTTTEQIETTTVQDLELTLNWTIAQGKLSSGRSEHCALVLDPGKIIILGGWPLTEKVEVFNIEAGIVTPLPDAANLPEPRSGAGCALWPPNNGLRATGLIVAGGSGSKDAFLDTVLLLDFTSGYKWVTLGNLKTPRKWFTMGVVGKYALTIFGGLTSRDVIVKRGGEEFRDLVPKLRGNKIALSTVERMVNLSWEGAGFGVQIAEGRYAHNMFVVNCLKESN